MVLRPYTVNTRVVKIQPKSKHCKFSFIHTTSFKAVNEVQFSALIPLLSGEEKLRVDPDTRATDICNKHGQTIRTAATAQISVPTSEIKISKQFPFFYKLGIRKIKILTNLLASGIAQ